MKGELNCGELEKAISFIKQLTLTTSVEKPKFLNTSDLSQIKAIF
jgi:hypothetical protein